ncbi:efflux RND transporter periplasmic adaptor subunit [Paeniroseomonas aquatica]|uniref:Efflux RND transporter periplasmic adaptor subunit n=1 Tax=Paeniroseomonas aquatica TaxID=373043 RepID=A0ABT8A6T1_9PROT|nr:efflux RND transporter periplasmic adaptor subunit [Paeniroseomonas aquatica]MDN3565429.1 efflux RND transporter periplasmic adaptor subunit [Paeniroseomonas aquatica]
MSRALSFPRAAVDRRRWSFLPAGLLAGLVLPLAACQEEAAKPAAPPPAAVTVLPLKPETVAITTELPGRTTPFRTAEVRPQVGGVIKERLFTEGAATEAGKPLYQIDPAPFQASLQSAEASQARAEAAATSARTTVNRYQPLVRARAVSQQDLDNALATLRQAEADIASAKASVTTARLNLGYTRVDAPIPGRTGRSSVTPGALVTADQTNALVTITQLDPIYVDVTQPSSTLLRLKRELAAGRLRRVADDQAEVHLTLEDGSDYAQAGRLQFSEVIVDPGTGSVTLRAVFPNPDGVLMPGMFVRAKLEEGTAEGVILVPQQAVARNAKGEATAMVVDAEGKVQPRIIRADRAIGNRWLVSEGLQANDRVIVEGLQRARPGAQVQATETTQQALDNPAKPAEGPGPQQRAAR